MRNIYKVIYIMIYMEIDIKTIKLMKNIFEYIKIMFCQFMDD